MSQVPRNEELDERYARDLRERRVNPASVSWAPSYFITTNFDAGLGPGSDLSGVFALFQIDDPDGWLAADGDEFVTCPIDGTYYIQAQVEADATSFGGRITLHVYDQFDTPLAFDVREDVAGISGGAVACATNLVGLRAGRVLRVEVDIDGGPGSTEAHLYNFSAFQVAPLGSTLIIDA